MNTITDINEISKMIDHSLLHPTMTDEDLRRGCEIAKKYNAATVCIKPYAIPIAKDILKGSGVEICTVIGFPHGNSKTIIKVAETEEACKDGATEIDMVINIGKAIGGDWEYIEKEILAINNKCIEHKAILKVIFENDYLSDDKIKIKLCEICSRIGVAFVKTSTGYGFVKQKDGSYNYKGATHPDLVLMRNNCNQKIQIKAAGGIRTLDELVSVMKLGVTRVGATATEAIVEEAKKRLK
jgi:deoxyribose-phosphate aldolase